MADDKPKPYRLTIDMVSPDSEIIKEFDTVNAATEHFKDCLKHGFVVQDRSGDGSLHQVTFYPMTRVRAFRIYSHQPFGPTTRPVKK